MPPAPAPVVAAESAGIDTMTKGFAASVAAATLNAAAADIVSSAAAIARTLRFMIRSI
jgi:hypothetical protein